MYLVGGIPTPLKIMSSSVGMMKFPIYGKINVPNFQTTSQYIYIIIYPCMYYIYMYMCVHIYIHIYGLYMIIPQING